jgi:hypothetical protein
LRGPDQRISIRRDGIALAPLLAAMILPGRVFAQCDARRRESDSGR